MSIGLNWFKSYRIIVDESFLYTSMNIEYFDGDSTSHSPGNVTKLQELLKKYGDIEIPTSSHIKDNNGNYELELIQPEILSNVCDIILKNSDVDKVDMRARVEWIKRLSDDGYYFVYDQIL